jgi:hypothetical protein
MAAALEYASLRLVKTMATGRYGIHGTALKGQPIPIKGRAFHSTCSFLSVGLTRGKTDDAAYNFHSFRLSAAVL